MACFIYVQPLDIGRPGYHPRMMLKLYIYGYLSRVPSSRWLERECPAQYRGDLAVGLRHGWQHDCRS
jgi:transposase